MAQLVLQGFAQGDVVLDQKNSTRGRHHGRKKRNLDIPYISPQFYIFVEFQDFSAFIRQIL